MSPKRAKSRPRAAIRVGNKRSEHRTAAGRQLDVRRDALDFRDRLFEPTLIEVPQYVDPDGYRKVGVPVLDQGQEGACTGFGLATVANYLLRRRRVESDATPVSPRMLYALARRYDEWEGESYSGSSARGAMKGWHKHGVCGEKVWPYKAEQDDTNLTEARSADAVKRPLGAYYRVNHTDLVAMHSAIAEVGVLYATAQVHEGWERVDPRSGEIPFLEGVTGGHAFALVGYDSRGFWLQNSWGLDWGKQGLARLTYDDWLANGDDVWVARLGAPMDLQGLRPGATGMTAAVLASSAVSFADLRPHVVSLGNDGRLRDSGALGSTVKSVQETIASIPARTANWKTRRVLLYAHGGLVPEDTAIQRIAEYRATLMEQEVYPLAFVWKTDYWTTLRNLLEDAVSRRKPEGALQAAKDFLLDRADDMLEPLARMLTGKAEWDEMKENALRASSSQGGGALVARELAKLMAAESNVELHIVGHSAGAILMAGLVQILTTRGAVAAGKPLAGQKGLGLDVASCTLWAPACTVELFTQTYKPAIDAGRLTRFALFTLTDQAERDDTCAHIYNKSLLYLVSNAFEKEARIPLFRDGWPLLGMEKFIGDDPALRTYLTTGPCEWILSPNSSPEGSKNAARATSHGDFDDDRPTLRATLARILDAKSSQAQFVFRRSAAGLRDRRRAM